MLDHSNHKNTVKVDTCTRTAGASTLTTVTATHLPTGLTASCDKYRGIFRNHKEALRMLDAQLRKLEEG